MQRSRSIRVSWVDDLEALVSRRDEWNALVACAETRTVFQSFEWHLGWWHAFGSGSQPLVLLAEDMGVLVGVAPLVLSKRRILGRRRRVAEFMGSRAADYCDFIVDSARPEASLALVQWLLEHSELWDLLMLANITRDATVGVLRERCERFGLPHTVRTLCKSPSLVCTDRDVIDVALQDKRLRRARRRFQSQGQVSFKSCATAKDISSHLGMFFEQHIRRRSMTDAPSKFLDGRWRTFYHDLAQALGAQGQMLLMTTFLDLRPIAFDLCFLFCKRLVVYDGCFDPSHAKRSPGTLALWYLFRYVQDHDIGELDLGRGEEAYKLRYTNYARVNRELRIYHRWLARSFDSLLLRIIAWLESSPTASSLVRRLLWLVQDRRWGRTG